MPDYKAVLGAIALTLVVVSYVPYYRDIFKGRTKPHAFSWLIWALVTGIAFFGQLSDGAGAGAWSTGFTALLCFSVFLLSLTKGEKEITVSDTISFFGALVAIALWYFTKNALWAVVLASIIDILGFYPTFRKSYKKPYEETLSIYILAGIKFIISIFALSNYSLTTALYLIVTAFMNFIFVAFVLSRRKQLASHNL